jgi:hypothetical protein
MAAENRGGNSHRSLVGLSRAGAIEQEAKELKRDLRGAFLVEATLSNTPIVGQREAIRRCVRARNQAAGASS